MTIKSTAKALLTISVFAGGASPALADDVDLVQVRKLQASGAILSFEKIAELARAIKPGDILETELEKRKGHYVYEVEMLDAKGVVWELKLNANTGELIKLEIDD
jgi:uncharacterized membrane protein YkoI